VTLLKCETVLPCVVALLVSVAYFLTFLAGVMSGFADKLGRQAKASASEGLVWVKDGDLDRFYRARHPYIRNVRYGGQRRTEAFAHGKEAGKNIVLKKPIRGGATDRGRLLSS